MDTEQIFATDVLDTTFIDSDDEVIPATQFDESSSSSQYEDAKSEPPDDVILTQQEIERAERIRLFNDPSIPFAERISQKFLLRFRKGGRKTFVVPERKPLPQEQREMFEITKNAMIAPSNLDMSMMSLTTKDERPRDKTPVEVRELCKSQGFITASRVHSIMSQATQPQAPSEVVVSIDNEEDFVINGLTQLEQQEERRLRSSNSSFCSTSSRTPKIVATVADAVLEDFEDIEDQTMAVVEAASLNESLGSLTQVLNSSKRAAELMESALSQNSSHNLDVTQIDLEALPSDDEDEMPNTEQLEDAFCNIFETQSDADENGSHVRSTQQLEDDFRNFPTQDDDVLTQAEPEPSTQQLEALLLSIPTQDIELQSQKVNKKPEPTIDDDFRDFAFTQAVEADSLEFHNAPSEQEPCCSKSFVSSDTGMFSGFSFASGKSNNLKEATMKKFQADFAADDLKFEQSLKATPGGFAGFGLASGKSVKVKDTTMDRFKIQFEREERKMALEAKLEDPPTPIARKPFKVPSALATPSSTSFTSTPASSKTRQNPPKVSTPDVPMSSFGGFATASGNNIKVSANVKRFAEAFEKQDEQLRRELQGTVDTTPAKPPLKKLRLDFGDSPVSPSPLLMDRFKRGINQHSTPLVSRIKKAAETMTDSQEVSALHEFLETFDGSDDDEDFAPQPPVKRTKLTKLRLANRFDSIESDNDEPAMLQKSEFVISGDVKAARKKAMDEQRESIKDKAHNDKLPMAGSVFMMKAAKNRMSMKEYVGSAVPMILNRHHITLKNAMDFKFAMRDFVSESTWRTNTAGISVGDNARLHFDEKSEVGIDEIELSFLASPGVDPKLLPIGWIHNSFKMIVLKLAWLENSFERFGKGELLSPENVLLQLKLRYDREIDRRQRSAIKKIVELDDVAYRRMVLKVVDVHSVPSVGCELELTDGWYTLRTSIDASLADAVDRGKIQTDTKLITSYAELVGCTGFDPLELPANVRLKIHANSTRRTSWDEKLGFCRNPQPIRIHLDSVLATGGVIGKLQLVVTHVYEVIYVDSSEDKKEFRSEKLQRRIQNKLDVHNFGLYERIAHQVQEQEMKELRGRAAQLEKFKLKVGELSGGDICDLLEAETDGDEKNLILKQISAGMLREVERVRDERNHDVDMKIRRKLGEQQKQVTQLLKFRVVDAMNPKRTGLVSWWSPTEEIKEDQTVEIFNATAGPHSQEIQVTAGKSSIVNLLRKKLPAETFKKFFRMETRIDELNRDFRPPHDEFDVAFIVAQVDEVQANGTQKVFVADERNDVMCLNFWSSIRESGFDDLAEGKFMYARNLQWRSSHAGDKIPQAFVNNVGTLLSTMPKKESQRRRLEQLKAAVGNIVEFLIDCSDKISEIESGNVAVNKENQRGVKADRLRTASQRPVFAKSFNNVSSPHPSTPRILVEPKEKTKRRLGMFGGSTTSRKGSQRAKPKHHRK